MSQQYYDALIIGAGISGISAAYHFKTNCPGKSYKVLERRAQLGGTWDLFKYPGIRSDSDMYTFGFSFRPWNDQAAIAQKSKIIDYLQETADEFEITPNIRFNTHIKRASWSSQQACWTVDTTAEEGGESISYGCQHIFMCTGYYNYDAGYTPEFADMEKFRGKVVHPQHWTDDIDYTDKKVVVIGSGATAVTLLPTMAEKAAHVTMLQRSPTYLGVKPAEDPKANWLAKWFGRRAARWWFILSSMFVYSYCKAFPQRAKAMMIGDIKQRLGDKFEAKHYTPNYDPWDQRVCLCPDGDFFDAISAGKASVVTDKIERFSESGIVLESGDELPADLVVTATGLDMLFVGGMEIAVDGSVLQANQSFVYKGFMINDIPNLYLATGYTNASWTLKVDLTNKYACRLINHLDQHGFKYCQATVTDKIDKAPLLDLSSGYVQRGKDRFPNQSSNAPWRLRQNFLIDKMNLSFTPLKDKAMTFR